MSLAKLTDLDVQLRAAVLRALDDDTQVDASGIGVTARNGAVTLTGDIGTYADKLAAERTAKRVAGVRAVANDLAVRLRHERTDADIAADIVKLLEVRRTIPDSVQAAVHNGHVTLTGQVDWFFQKRDAEEAVRCIRGVRGVADHIAVAPRPVEREVQVESRIDGEPRSGDAVPDEIC